MQDTSRKTVTVDVATDTEGPRKFSAGNCVLIFGGIPLEAYMAICEDEGKPGSRQRWLSTRDDVITWLMNHGLPGDRATALVDNTGDHAHEEIEVKKEVDDGL